MAFVLGQRSLDRLKGVHPDLVRVVKRAIKLTDTDFTVLEGVRTLAKQREYVKAGASRTMNSRHLTGHAVDLGALVNGKVRWDWPLYGRIAKAMKDAAKQEGVAIVWGGDWLRFRDGPHFELDRKKYPAAAK
jgi:peptidoglycan L-alanyl-D-glutamate endopeptidase CwlK